MGKDQRAVGNRFIVIHGPVCSVGGLDMVYSPWVFFVSVCCNSMWVCVSGVLWSVFCWFASVEADFLCISGWGCWEGRQALRRRGGLPPPVFRSGKFAPDPKGASTVGPVRTSAVFNFLLQESTSW